MKRRITIAVSLALLVALALYGAALAQGPDVFPQELPGQGWHVNWQIQNVSQNDTANVTVQALGMKDSNFGSGTASVQIPPRAGVTFIPGYLNPLSPELEEGFIGSAVVSSDQPIVAIAFVKNRVVVDLGIAGGLAGAAYQGVSGEDAGDRVNFPIVKLNWVNNSTTYYVQAAGQATSVRMHYMMQDGTQAMTDWVALNADEMYRFTPTDTINQPANCGSFGASPCLGSAYAEADGGDIVGIYTEHPTTGDPAPYVMSTRGLSPNEAATELFAPVVKYNWVGNTSGIVVQNADDTQITLNATFTGAPPAACDGDTFSPPAVTLDPGESHVYYPGPTVDNMADFPSNCWGSARLTADGDIVATVNEEGGNKRTTYAAFPVESSTRRVALPLVKEDWGSAADPNEGVRTTGVVIQNVGNNPTDVNVIYTITGSDFGHADEAVNLNTLEIPARSSIALWRIYQNPGTYGTSVDDLNKSYSSVIATSTSENIVAIAQEESVSGPQDSENYEGFNISVSP